MFALFFYTTEYNRFKTVYDSHTERKKLIECRLGRRYSEVIVRESSHFVINKEFTKCQLFSVTNVSKIS